MKIIFFGSDDFATTNLKALIESKHKVIGCVAPPDKPKGRGMKIAESPVKTVALAAGIPVWQPAALKDEPLIRSLKELKSDLFVVIAYGKILPQTVLSIPRICSINVHASLLPRYRGAAPINWAIINGERETGVSVIRMNPQMDAGDIVLQKNLWIEDQDDAVSLRKRLSELSVGALLDAADQLEEGQARFVAQDAAHVSLAPKLTKQFGFVDWNQPAVGIHRLVRGLLPWPAAWTVFNGKSLKILETQVVSGRTAAQPGEVLNVSPEGFTVACQKDAVRVIQVHPESGRPMDIRSFTAGYKLTPGHRF